MEEIVKIRGQRLIKEHCIRLGLGLGSSIIGFTHH